MLWSRWGSTRPWTFPIAGDRPGRAGVSCGELLRPSPLRAVASLLVCASLAIAGCASHTEIVETKRPSPTCSPLFGFTNCSEGNAAELRGLAKVFVYTPAKRAGGSAQQGFEEIATQSNARIVAAVEAARVGLTVVGGAEKAEIIVAFHTDGWRSPACMHNPGYGPDLGVGEVYIVRANSTRVVMRFSRECSIYRRWVATTFAREFIRLYKEANKSSAATKPRRVLFNLHRSG